MEKANKAKERRAYMSNWDKNNRFPVSIRLRRREDAELIEVYKGIANKSEWLRGCLTAEKNKAA